MLRMSLFVLYLCSREVLAYVSHFEDLLTIFLGHPWCQVVLSVLQTNVLILCHCGRIHHCLLGGKSSHINDNTFLWEVYLESVAPWTLSSSLLGFLVLDSDIH